MKNDQTYVVNGREAVFNASVVKTAMFYFPAAVFVFKDTGEVLKVIYNTISSEQYVENDKPFDLDIYFDGQWHQGKRG
ncbi:hypothetical protein HWC54_gp091 [Klebsiella phage Marfa]|uniref:Uncharacterized protein n=1 Tax=Klebsiella phage Marfa TaxID=2587809 RepID=A0A4Y5TQW9_9CAUD|nr:hypothetical protein HWC54_gp091 [Klebsiella phage Marfa]QDB71746.1 hypothetical protein CPT_Marfa_091 [Klebsiella phage Marfa]